MQSQTGVERRSGVSWAAAWMSVVMVAGVLGLAAGRTAEGQDWKHLTVPVVGSKGEDLGVVKLSAMAGGVRFKFDLKNLSPGLHGVHLHQHAVCDAPLFAGAGGHYNPTGMKHGYKNPAGHHEGDFPENLTVGSNGRVKTTMVLTGVTLNPAGVNSLLTDGGRALVVHAGPDDEMTDPSGGSGARVGCGVIQEP